MLVLSDLRTAIRKDPALHGSHAVEVLLYGGLWALWTHRVAHALWRAGVPFAPRLLSEAARRLTGIELHPGATIGHGVFIDHGTGVVVGETAVVGDDCMLYHGVTLGGRGWWVDAKGTKRHPTVGRGVTLGVGASVLGDVTVGDGARVGPHAVVVDDVPAGCVVVAPASRCVRLRRGDEPPTTDEADAEPPAWLTTTYEMGGL